MNRIRRTESDSDRSSVVSGKSVGRWKKDLAEASEWPGETEPTLKNFSSSKTSSIRSYAMEADGKHLPAPKKGARIGRASSISSYRMDDDNDGFGSKKVGSSTRKASSIRSYRMDYSENDVFTPNKVGSSSNKKASSIRSYRMEGEDEEDITPRVSMGPARNSSYSTPRIGRNATHTDPYAVLRIADTFRTSHDLENSYTHTPLRIAPDSQLNGRSFTTGNADANSDPYVALKVAGSHQSGADYGEIVYDSSNSSDSEEYSNSSDTGGDSGSEDHHESRNINARVSVAGSESGQGKAAGYARVSVAGSPGDNGRPVGREFLGYARVSVAGSESDHANDGGENPRGYARVSAPASDVVYARESDHGNGNYLKVSVASRDIYQGQDVYARLSVAGSAAEPAKVSAALARVSSVGSERDQRKDGYARVYVSGSESEYPNGLNKELSGHERLSVDENNVQHIPVENEVEVYEPEDKQYAAYLELSPELQAKLQYRVRVVLISPLFELKKKHPSEFLAIYRNKFGGDDGGSFPFTSVAILCQSMPGVIQRNQSEDTEELTPVDSVDNRRAVCGIRSGLRRILYDALKSVHDNLTCAELEERCSELLGKPLVEVLSEHGYDAATVESLIKDMPDIVSVKEAGPVSRVCLSAVAEDPALTDGLLVRSAFRASLSTLKSAELNGVISQVEDVGGEVATGVGHLKIGSSVTLRSLRNKFGRSEVSSSAPSVSSFEDECLQVRLRMRILLAFYNSGRGVEAKELMETFSKCFGRSFVLEELGFSSVIDLAKQWNDICLLQEPSTGCVCLVPSQANRRILNTFRTGLRSSVFSALVKTYPEGLDPLDFLHRLQEVTSGELWEVLEAAGYTCSDAEKANSTLSRSTSLDFQLVDFEEICLLLDDMMDFVRLGSNDDGSAVVKLRSGEVPLLDLMDCKLNESDLGNFDELFVNLLIIAVDGTDNLEADDGSLLENNGSVSMGHVQLLVKSFEGSGGGGLRSAYSREVDSLRFKHELRLILGCPEYSESGLAFSELNTVYKVRTGGQELGSKSKVRSLLRAMPDIASKDSLLGDVVKLSMTPKNLRILSTTRAGLRQVLFWSLVKNPGGIWANLLEGWFTDFSGVSLAATLQMHGYEMSKSKPFYAVQVFLRDMSDLLQRKSAPVEVYTWAGEVADPIHNDASLLGLSELLIQYDPLKFKLETVSKREAELVEELVDESALKEDEGPKEADSGTDAVLENFPLEEANGDAKAGWEAEASVKEEETEGEMKLDRQDVDSPSMEQERRGNGLHLVHSEDELGSGETEGPERQKAIPECNDGDEFLRGRIGRHGGQKWTVERQKDFANPLVGDGEDSHGIGENEHITEQDERQVPQIEENHVSSTSEAQAQLRLADNGPGTTATELPSDSNGQNGAGVVENGQAAEEDESRLPQIKGDRSRSTSESSYAQLRVAEKGPKVNLEEQYSGSDEEEGFDSDEIEEPADEDESHPQHMDGDLERSDSESYAQLRVTGKGPKVNLDEWQFTDSEDEEEAEDTGEDEEGEDDEEEEEGVSEEEDEEDEVDEENAKPANTAQGPGQTSPIHSYAGPKAKETGKNASIALASPKKGVPWK